MTPHRLFLIFNFGLLPAWALLALAPRWKWTRRLVHSALLPVMLGLAYSAILFTTRPPDHAGGQDLDAAMRLFSAPWMALAGWIHYLVIDLFVGAWQVRDAARHHISHLAILPCLLLTLFYAPAGLLCYLIVRALMRKAVALDEQSASP
jgi:hypothetical protein